MMALRCPAALHYNLPKIDYGTSGAVLTAYRPLASRPIQEAAHLGQSCTTTAFPFRPKTLTGRPLQTAVDCGAKVVGSCARYPLLTSITAQSLPVRWNGLGIFSWSNSASQLIAVLDCHTLQSFIAPAPLTKLSAATTIVFVAGPDIDVYVPIKTAAVPKH